MLKEVSFEWYTIRFGSRTQKLEIHIELILPCEKTAI